MQIQNAYLEEMVYLIPDPANVTISLKNINQKALSPKIKPILVIVIGAENKQLSAATIEMISKMITAVKLNPEDVPVIFAGNGSGIQLKNIQNQLRPSCLLIMGAEPESLHFYAHIEKYITLNFNNMNIVLCDAPEALDPGAKKALWKCLQNIFPT